MKKITKIFALAMSVALAGSMAACGGEKAPDTAEVIELSYWSSGLGEEYIKETIKNFEIKYPQYKVYFDSSPNGGAINNTFGYGANYDTVDLYMYAINGLQEEDILEYAEPLDDLVQSKYENEAMTIEEKILPTFRNSLKSSDGSYRSLTYGGGWTGIAYNMNIIDGVRLKVPNTTNELVRLAAEIDDSVRGENGKPIPPFIHYMGGGYWMTAVTAWQIQYDGADYYFNTFLPLNDGTNSPSKAVLMAEDGRKAAMDVMEKLVTPGYVYNGSNGLVFSDAQTYFLNAQAAMMVNGSWMINEMKQHLQEGQDFSMMRMPVISAIRNKCEKIDTDAELSALITAIDAADSVTDVPTKGADYDVSEADVQRIWDARNTMHSNFNEHGMLIPKYATAKEAAKVFIKYFYSDENLKMYHDVTHMTIPVQYSDGSKVDTTGWREWELRQQMFTDKCQTFSNKTANTSKIFTAGGCHMFANIDFISTFSNTNSSYRKSSDELWKDMLNTFDSNWDIYVNNAQLG